MSMPMGTTNSTSEMEVMMIPWLHFTGGDKLFFNSLQPSSHGAIAGACIVLALLAILDRYVSAMRAVAQARWAHRSAATALSSMSHSVDDSIFPQPPRTISRCRTDGDDV